MHYFYRLYLQVPTDGEGSQSAHYYTHVAARTEESTEPEPHPSKQSPSNTADDILGPGKSPTKCAFRV